MWRVKTGLFAEAEKLVSELKNTPGPEGVGAHFDWSLHFDQLAKAHSRQSSYSLRYHHGERLFADPIAFTVVLSNIWLTEQRKVRN